MFFSCHDMLQITDMKTAKVLAGKGGLDHLIYHVQALDIPDIMDWVRQGDLIFTTCCCFQNPEEDLMELLHVMYQKRAAGLIISIGPYLKSVSDEVLEKADTYGVPLIHVPYELHTGDVIYQMNRILNDLNNKRSIRDSILTDLFFSDYRIELEDRLAVLEYDKTAPHVAIIFSIDQKTGALENQRNDALKYIDKKVMNSCERINSKAYSLIQGSEVTVLFELQQEMDVNTKIMSILAQIQTEITVHYEAITVSIGISAPCKRLNQVKDAVRQGFQAVRNIYSCEKKNIIRSFQDIGIYRLFFSHSPEELVDIMNYYIGNLISYNEEKSKMNLLTLDCYLTNNCQLGKTADELYIHKNTLKYRLQNIKEALGNDLTDSNTIFHMRMALKIKRYLEYEYPDIWL